MGDAYGRVRGVDGLTSGSGGAEDVNAQVVRVDLQLTGVVDLRHHQHTGGRGVDASLALGDGHALDAVDPALVLQVSPDPVLRLHGRAGLNRQADVLVAAQVRVGGVQDLHRPAHALGVAGVHTCQVRGEEGGLLTTLAGLDLDDDVAGIIGVTGHEHLAQVLGRRLGSRLESGDLSGEVGVTLSQLDGVVIVSLRRLPSTVGAHDPPELGVAPSQPAHRARVGADGRVSHLALDAEVFLQQGQRG